MTDLPKPTGVKFEKVLLRPDDLEDKTKTVKVLEAPTAADPEFSQYANLQVKVEMDGLQYILPLDTQKQNYLMLYDALGADPAAWVGKTFKLRAKFSRRYETDFVSVVREKK